MANGVKPTRSPAKKQIGRQKDYKAFDFCRNYPAAPKAVRHENRVLWALLGIGRGLIFGLLIALRLFI